MPLKLAGGKRWQLPHLKPLWQGHHHRPLVEPFCAYDVAFTQFSKDGFGWEEQERAAAWLSKHKGPVILSNQATPRILKLYRSLGFALTFLHGSRRISCTGDRTPAAEVLAIRHLTA